MISKRSKEKNQIISELSRNRVSVHTHKPTTALAKYQRKLENSLYDDFVASDWRKYIQGKALAHELHYTGGNMHATNAIIKSVMADFTSTDIKLMIDFIFDSGQTAFDFSGNPIMALSKKWLGYTFNNSQKWAKGTYANKVSNQSRTGRNRESRLKRSTKVSGIDIGGGVSI